MLRCCLTLKHLWLLNGISTPHDSIKQRCHVCFCNGFKGLWVDRALLIFYEISYITLFTAWKIWADGSVKIPAISNAEILFMKLDHLTCHNCPQFVNTLSLEKLQLALSGQSLGIPTFQVYPLDY